MQVLLIVGVLDIVIWLRACWCLLVWLLVVLFGLGWTVVYCVLICEVFGCRVCVLLVRKWVGLGFLVSCFSADCGCLAVLAGLVVGWLVVLGFDWCVCVCCLLLCSVVVHCGCGYLLVITFTGFVDASCCLAGY